MIRVAVAEDQGLVRDALVQLLGREPDFTVVGEAATGKEAISLSDLLPDIMLVDVEMPEMDGIQACREIVARQPTVRVVILTTFARPGNLRRALAAGACGFLLKDDPVSVLAEKLRAVIAGERPVDPALAVSALISGPSPLTSRETEILRAAADGRPIAEIARQLFLSEGTVRNYLSVIIQKLGVENRIQAVHQAEQNGWL